MYDLLKLYRNPYRHNHCTVATFTILPPLRGAVFTMNLIRTIFRRTLVTGILFAGVAVPVIGLGCVDRVHHVVQCNDDLRHCPCPGC